LARFWYFFISDAFTVLCNCVLFRVIRVGLPEELGKPFLFPAVWEKRTVQTTMQKALHLLISNKPKPPNTVSDSSSNKARLFSLFV
jgi:hypothetical protein